MKKLLALTTLLVLTSACTDATLGKLKALGNKAKIECYSGGKLIYEGTSSGKVKSEANSDGYFFKDEQGTPREVSGNCVITYLP